MRYFLTFPISHSPFSLFWIFGLYALSEFFIFYFVCTFSFVFTFFLSLPLVFGEGFVDEWNMERREGEKDITQGVGIQLEREEGRDRNG